MHRDERGAGGGQPVVAEAEPRALLHHFNDASVTIRTLLLLLLPTATAFCSGEGEEVAIASSHRLFAPAERFSPAVGGRLFSSLLAVVVVIVIDIIFAMHVASTTGASVSCREKGRLVGGVSDTVSDPLCGQHIRVGGANVRAVRRRVSVPPDAHVARAGGGDDEAAVEVEADRYDWACVVAVPPEHLPIGGVKGLDKAILFAQKHNAGRAVDGSGGGGGDGIRVRRICGNDFSRPCGPRPQGADGHCDDRRAADADREDRLVRGFVGGFGAGLCVETANRPSAKKERSVGPAGVARREDGRGAAAAADGQHSLQRRGEAAGGGRLTTANSRAEQTPPATLFRLLLECRGWACTAATATTAARARAIVTVNV